MPRIAILHSLVDKYRHDCEFVVRLEEQVFYYLKPRRATEIRRRIVDRSAEIAACPGPILNAECVIAAMPLEALVTQSKRISTLSGNVGAGRGLAAFGGCEIEPPTPKACGTLQVIQ